MGVWDVFKGKKEKDQGKQEGAEQPKTLEEGLEKTKSSFFSRIGRALAGKSTVDAEFLDELEDVLISSDVGVDTTVKIIERLEKRVSKDKFLKVSELNYLLREEVAGLLGDKQPMDISGFKIPDKERPHVIMVVGVNGVGKTTTIGKLAYQFKQNGHKVMVGASDTFRAAAIDQLKIWSDRADVPLVSREMGSDPASVAYDTVNSARAKGYDVVILDTAGRLHNKSHLMRELGKIKKVVGKVIPEGPHEVMLVLDASTGQNAIEQARQFINVTEVNSIALTKLDGTAKGGVVLGIVDQFQIPVKYIGIGEKLEDLRTFDKKDFVESLFEDAGKFA